MILSRRTVCTVLYTGKSLRNGRRRPTVASYLTQKAVETLQMLRLYEKQQDDDDGDSGLIFTIRSTWMGHEAADRAGA